MNIFKDNNYFNQNIIENDNFKYIFKLLTSSTNIDEISKLISRVLYDSDNSCFKVSNSRYDISVESNNFMIYENNEKPINCGYIDIIINNHLKGETLEINNTTKDKSLTITKTSNNSSFTLIGVEDNNGVVYVDTKSSNKSHFQAKSLKRTSK